MRYVLLYLALTFAAGAGLGWFLSPDWNDSHTADRFLEETTVPEFGFRNDVVLRAMCGPQLYTYTSEHDSIGVEKADPNYELDPYRPRGNLLYGLPAPLLLLFSGDDSTVILVISTVVVAGGFIAGYHLANDGDPDCGTEAMKTSLEDKGTWKAIASRLLKIRAAAMGTSIEDYCASRPRWYRWESESHNTIQSQFAAVTDPPDLVFLDRLCSTSSQATRTAQDVFQVSRNVVMKTPVKDYCESRPRWYRLESREHTDLQMKFRSVLHPPKLELLNGLCKTPSSLDWTTHRALEGSDQQGA